MTEGDGPTRPAQVTTQRTWWHSRWANDWLLAGCRGELPEVPELVYTRHALDVMQERELAQDWIERVVAGPAVVEHSTDGTVHYIGRIAERDDRLLRVVVAGEPEPHRVVTAFFDRRLRRKA